MKNKVYEIAWHALNCCETCKQWIWMTFEKTRFLLTIVHRLEKNLLFSVHRNILSALFYFLYWPDGPDACKWDHSECQLGQNRQVGPKRPISMLYRSMTLIGMKMDDINKSQAAQRIKIQKHVQKGRLGVRWLELHHLQYLNDLMAQIEVGRYDLLVIIQLDTQSSELNITGYAAFRKEGKIEQMFVKGENKCSD